jgi:uncharacterized protein
MNKLNSNINLIKEFYLNFKNQNVNSYLNLIDENIQWITMESMPNGGIHIGKVDVFEKYFPSMFANFEEFHAIADEYLDIENNGVLVLGKYSIKSKKHIQGFVPFAHIYNIKNGKIHKFRQYTDTAKIDKILN